MAAVNNDLRIVDGQFDWSNGVNSSKVSTIAGPSNPNGLGRQNLAWLVNGTVRGGGIYQRQGWQPRVQNAIWSGRYQGKGVYSPSGAFPYIMCQIGGRIYKIDVTPNYVVTDLSAIFGLTNPPDIEQAFFCQGEEFMVIQAGDYSTLPLFWDGTTLRRSTGITPPTTTSAQITIKNVDDVHVGTTIPAGQSVQTTDVLNPNYVLLNITNLNSFVMPAIGASVVVTVFTVTFSTLPQQFRLFLPGGLSKTGLLEATAFAPATTTGGFYELPAAGPMAYWMGRVWYAFGRSFTAGDIVRGPSGTAGAPYFKRDSILKVTENQVAANGDGFQLSSTAGNITSVFETQELNTQTGEGKLYVGTRQVIYRFNVPVTRDDWTAAGDGTGGTFIPFQTVAVLNYGPTSNRCIVQANSDVFYQTLEPAIRSIQTSTIRNVPDWGNTGISNNVRRALVLNDRNLMQAATGIQFLNRFYQSCLPFETPVGIAHKGIVVLDFELITTLEEKLPPAWEGLLEGLHWLDLLEADFGGLSKAFGFIVSQINGEIELWEMTQADKRDDGDKRIPMMIETPSFTFGNPFSLKELESLEIWYDKIFGSLEVEIFYRPDQHPCWIPWAAFKDCAARDCTEDIEATAGCSGTYPNAQYCEQYRSTKSLPKPQSICLQQSGRPANQAFQFQVKILSRGSWRIRGLLLSAIPRGLTPFHNLVC